MMKRYTLLYIIGSMLAGSPMMGQVSVRWSPEPQQELGTIDESAGVVTRRFVARNAGEYSWQVLRSYTSCGCTKAEIEQDQVVRPGDSTIVNVTFDPKGKAGPVHEVVTIQLTDGEDTVNETLTLIGEVRRSAESLRKQFPIDMGEDLRLNTDKVDFGEVRKGQTTERHIAICSTSDTPVTLSAKPTSSAIKTSWDEGTTTILPNETLDLALSWQGDAEPQWGLAQEQLTLECSQSTGRATVSLSAIILPQASNDPSQAPSLQTERRVDLSATPQGPTIVYQLPVKNTGNASLQVLRIYSDKAKVEIPTRLPLALKPSQSTSIEIRITPKSDTEVPITIISTDTKRPRQTVRMRLK